jgi:hypothetical protein
MVVVCGSEPWTGAEAGIFCGAMVLRSTGEDAGLREEVGVIGAISLPDGTGIGFEGKR